MNKKEVLLFVIGVLIVLASPTIFTQPSMLSQWDFTKTGTIGDTIGGITAPFIGLLGALLIFLSFKQQVKANEKLKEQIQFGQQTTNYEILNSLFNEIRNETEKLTYDPNISASDMEKLKKGVGAFKAFAEIIESEIKTGRPYMNEFGENLDYILSLHEIFLTQLKQIPLNEDFKTILLSKYNHYYENHHSFYADRILHVITENKTNDFDTLKNRLTRIKALIVTLKNK